MKYTPVKTKLWLARQCERLEIISLWWKMYLNLVMHVFSSEDLVKTLVHYLNECEYQFSGLTLEYDLTNVKKKDGYKQR